MSSAKKPSSTSWTSKLKDKYPNNKLLLSLLKSKEKRLTIKLLFKLITCFLKKKSQNLPYPKLIDYLSTKTMSVNSNLFSLALLKNKREKQTTQFKYNLKSKKSIKKSSKLKKYHHRSPFKNNNFQSYNLMTSNLSHQSFKIMKPHLLLTLWIPPKKIRWKSEKWYLVRLFTIKTTNN